MSRGGSLYKRIGEKLSFERRRRGLTQESLAADAHVDRSYLSKVEHGEIEISIRNLQKITKRLRIPLHQLFEDISKM